MDTPEPFKVDIPQSDLDELHFRLARTRWPDQLPEVGWSYGVNRDYLVDLVGYWRTGFDWRAVEARLNTFPQFTTTIDGQRVHFLHVRSPEPDATPLILTHGWPSTAYDFLDVIGPLTDPASRGRDPVDAFHVVVPSVPGFGFSGPTLEKGWGTVRTARAWDELMRGLGYPRYGAQGGDFGSIVSPEIGRQFPDRVIGVHVNALVNASVAVDPGDLDRLTPSERERAERHGVEWEMHSGYAVQMGSRPQTIAYALNDSPAGQLAWNIEWFVDWDPAQMTQTPVSRDAILTNVSVFWLTGTAGSAARLYLEAGAEGWGARPEPSGVPTGVVNFRGDSALRGLAEISNTVVHWSEYDTGGHFASLQAPESLVEDIRAFFRALRAPR